MSKKKLIFFVAKLGMVGALFTLIFRPDLLGFDEGLFGGVRVVDVLLSIPSLLLSLAVVAGLGFGPVQVAVAVGIGSQCARNHKPDLKIPGTVDPAELLKAQDKAQDEAETVNA